MMDQYAMMNESPAARMQREAATMAAPRNMNPLATLLGCVGPTFVHGPYESQSMNRKLAEAKKFLSSIKEVQCNPESIPSSNPV